MARLYKISHHSSHKASTPLSLKGKILAISENVSGPVDIFKSLVVLLNLSCNVLMLDGTVCVSGVSGVIATVRP
jgi:hypothetical protein